MARFEMANGSYPIDTCADVSDAAKLAHHSGTYSFAQVRAHVMKAKRALGCPDSVLPATWSQRTLASEDQMSEIERRYTLVPVELRANGERRSIGGYAAKFGSLSQNLGGFVERVDPAFFNKARGDGWPGVVCRYNHRDDYLLGSSQGRTLRLQIDGIGLNYEADPPQSRQDVVELVERGDVSKSSFAFDHAESDWGLSEQSYPMRTLVTGRMIDVAPCHAGIAAYPDTTVGLRSLAEHFGAELEEVRTLANENELRKFFIRTDGKPGPKKGLTGAQALIALQSRADPLEGIS